MGQTTCRKECCNMQTQTPASASWKSFCRKHRFLIWRSAITAAVRWWWGYGKTDASRCGCSGLKAPRCWNRQYAKPGIRLSGKQGGNACSSCGTQQVCGNCCQISVQALSRYGNFTARCRLRCHSRCNGARKLRLCMIMHRRQEASMRQSKKRWPGNRSCCVREPGSFWKSRSVTVAGSCRRIKTSCMRCWWPKATLPPESWIFRYSGWTSWRVRSGCGT